MINPKYLPEAKELKNCIARNQRYLRENPYMAAMVNPENYHAERARTEIAEAKLRMAILRSRL